MKFNGLAIAILFTGIYQGICFAAAVQPEQPALPVELEESRIVKPPKSENIILPHKQVKIIVYADKFAFADKLYEYLRDKAIQRQLENALNVTIADMFFINEPEQFPTEMKLKGQPERVIFAFGSSATNVVLTYLNKLTMPDLVHSVILFDPSIPSDRLLYGSQLIPNYGVISNRVYNIYSRGDPFGFWRKVFPALNEELPAQIGDQYYFKGINICAQVLDENGKQQENFDFISMTQKDFSIIIATIAKTNLYKLQTDLNAIIKNNTLESIRKMSLTRLCKSESDLPIVLLRDAMNLDETVQPPIISTAIIDVTGGKFVKYNASYVCHIPHDLLGYVRNTLINEVALSTYGEQVLSLKEAKIEDKLCEFNLVDKNRYTQGKLGAESRDKVSKKIKTYRLEKEYIAKRKKLVIPALQELCKGPANYINIAIVASGGGSRAMFATYGVLKGLQTLGVLAATSYICGLSGSTWAISTLFDQVNGEPRTTNIKQAIKSASEFSARHSERFGFLTEAVLEAPIRKIRQYPTTVKVKSLEYQPITNTDFYGCAIARTLLGWGDEIYGIDYEPKYLSLQLGDKARWQHKKYHIPDDYTAWLPFPIYTAVTPSFFVKPEYYPWFEFTPYQIGAVLGLGDFQTGMFVKTWAFGREFIYGKSKDEAPEQALEFYLGVFGSAMNASLHESIAMAPSAIKSFAKGTAYIASWIPGAGYINPYYRWRFAEVLNPMYLLDDARFNDYNKNKNLALIDAGIAFNLPFPPLNDYDNRRPQRKPDIIIFIDASADVDDVNSVNDFGQKTKQAWPKGNALQAVAEYARINKVAFPELPPKWVNLARTTCSIFTKQYKEDRQEPVVIYLPVTKNSTELNNEGLLRYIKQENAINGIKPINLADIKLSDYPTRYTAVSIQHAANLMALMEYNVLFHGDEIKEAICDRARQAAVR